MPATVRSVSCSVTFASVVLTDVISVRGEVSADGGWPTCSVFVTHKPETGNEEDGLQVVAGAGNDIIRFQGRVRRFRPSGFPKSIELAATGTLAYAAEWSPAEEIRFFLEFPSGVTDQALVQWALDKVPGVTYVPGNIDGTGVTLGWPRAWEAFDWKSGTTAWSYIQNIDRATLYRTYQDHLGAIRRVKMIGHPNDAPDFTLAPADMLDGAAGTRNTEQTRNAVEVRGHDYGVGVAATLGIVYGSNDFQGDGTNPATRHLEVFQSDLIQSGTDIFGTFYDNGGLDARDIAAAVLPDVNKEFVEAQIPSWRDDLHGPGLTALVDALERLAIGEPMWVVKYAWEVGDNGWTTTYGLTGGGLPQTYDPPPV
jgi:hypothetical protein